MIIVGMSKWVLISSREGMFHGYFVHEFLADTFLSLGEKIRKYFRNEGREDKNIS
jgi:hypothetical protein